MRDGDLKFPSETILELSELLGARFDAALPWLEIAAAFFATAKSVKVPARVRKEIEHLIGRLSDVQRTAGRLSPEAVDLLGEFNDVEATQRTEPFVTAYDSLRHISQDCARLSSVARMGCITGVSPGSVLAIGVASALAIAKVPISKGRDGTFARVFATIWHGIDPSGVPEETSRYCRRAADRVLADHPELHVIKGRPKSRPRRGK